MGRNVNSANLTKHYILNKVSQVTIFSTYLGLSNNIIQHCINTGEFITSPIRIDEHPTVGFKYDTKGKLKMRDFSGHFWGDCFDLVAHIMSEMYRPIDISNKQDFISVLRHITFVFKDIFYGQEKDISLIYEINNAIVNIRNKKPIIELVVRNWNNQDKQIWEDVGVTLQYLNLNFIYPIDQYYINRKINPEPKYYYKPSDPCYAYMLGKDKNGIHNIKLYFPKRPKGMTRFITNCNHLEGIYNLDRDDYNVICITKSTKDRVSLGSTIKRMQFLYGGDNGMNVGIINIPHETYKLRQNEYDWIKSKLGKGGVIVSLMDNDRVGISQAIWLRDTYVIRPIIIPKYLSSKDFAELRFNQGFDKVSNLITDTFNYIINNEYVPKSFNHFRKSAGDSGESSDVPF